MRLVSIDDNGNGQERYVIIWNWEEDVNDIKLNVIHIIKSTVRKKLGISAAT